MKDAALRKRAAEVLLALFPAQDEPQNRELAPALAWCGGGEAIQKLLEAIGNSANNRPLQLHYAQSLRSIKDGWRTDQKAAMLAWFGKAAEWPGNASFTKSLSQLFQAILNNGAFSRQESRLARQRFPSLAGATAAPGNLLTADEMFDLQTSNPPPAATPGKGREIFEKQCASCHRLGTLGNEAGPDLTELAKRLDKTAILEAILWPSREVPERYASVAIELADGSEIEGLVVREDDKVLLLKTATEPRPVSILKSRVKSRQASEKSIMPEGLLDGYDNGAIASLMAFLQ